MQTSVCARCLGRVQTEGFTTRGMGSDRSLGFRFIRVTFRLVPTRRFAIPCLRNETDKTRSCRTTTFRRSMVAAGFPLGKDGLPIDQVRPMYAVTDDLRKPVVHVGIAAQWNPRGGKPAGSDQRNRCGESLRTLLHRFWRRRCKRLCCSISEDHARRRWCDSSAGALWLPWAHLRF